MPDGTTGYTRDGSFQVSAQGQLVTNNGYTVQPGITIPAKAQSVTIGSDGTVSVHAARPGDAADGRPAAARQLRQPGRPRARRARTCTPRPPPRARRTAGAPGSNGLGTLQQGFVETSNVNVVEELVGDDPDAARLRAELEGDPDLRPDAAEARPAVSAPTMQMQRFPASAGARRASLVRRGAARCVRDAQSAARRSTSPSRPTRSRRRSPRRSPATARSSRPAQYRPLFEDHRARLVGDTLTVQIVEKVTASQKSTSSIDKSGKVSRRHHRAAAAVAPIRSAAHSGGRHLEQHLRRQGQHREHQRLLRHHHRDGDRRARQRPPAGRRREADRRQRQRRRAALLGPGRPARDPARQHRAVGADRQRAHRAPRPRPAGRGAGNRLARHGSF